MVPRWPRAGSRARFRRHCRRDLACPGSRRCAPPGHVRSSRSVLRLSGIHRRRPRHRSFLEPGRRDEYLVLSAARRRPRAASAGPGPDAGPTVAADGTIAFINSRWRNSLDLHSLSSGTTRTLATHSPFMWGPAFSPDGSEITFSRSEVDGSWHLWKIPASGGTPQRLTETGSGEVYRATLAMALSSCFTRGARRVESAASPVPEARRR